MKAKRYCRRHALEHEGQDPEVDVVAVILCHEALEPNFEDGDEHALEHEGQEVL